MTWRSFVVISKFGGHVHTELGNVLSPSHSPQFPPLHLDFDTGRKVDLENDTRRRDGPPPTPSFTAISALGGGTTLVPSILTQRGELHLPVVSKRGQMTQQGDSGVGEWKGKWHGKGHGRDDKGGGGPSCPSSKLVRFSLLHHLSYILTLLQQKTRCHHLSATLQPSKLHSISGVVGFCWPPGPNFNKRDKVSLFLPPPIRTRCVPPFFKCLPFY